LTNSFAFGKPVRSCKQLRHSLPVASVSSI
jgi:hypothetical protein